MSIHYFAAIPGVAALARLQEALAWAEQHTHGCPFTGASTHLYPKGSMGKMATKGGHDDNNGPAATTCWQNLGVAASQARLQLVVVVHGRDVVLEAPKGQMALFHCNQCPRWAKGRTQRLARASHCVCTQGYRILWAGCMCMP